mmetsp:Transcript_21473/g.38966  ORF Transcript_21473/g.38966 Transcript_21473/m.38966 type:complete len:243 (+) Transcript_21473:300-1028(+)
MHAILHVATPATHKSLMTLLEPIHSAKKTPSVETLLHRMYEPILWRSLRAASPRVRVNASTVLSATFPLKPRSASPKEIERAIQKGISALEALLTDIACSRSWIGSDCKDIVAKHPSDKSASAVRAGAVQAISLLLEAEESHAVLRVLLPSIGNLMHDKVECVRLATVKLLLQVKKIRGIKYYHVVPWNTYMSTCRGRTASTQSSWAGIIWLDRAHDELILSTKTQCIWSRPSQENHCIPYV